MLCGEYLSNSGWSVMSNWFTTSPTSRVYAAGVLLDLIMV
jgi:hypothetical protein